MPCFVLKQVLTCPSYFELFMATLPGWAQDLPLPAIAAVLLAPVLEAPCDLRFFSEILHQHPAVLFLSAFLWLPQLVAKFLENLTDTPTAPILLQHLLKCVFGRPAFEETTRNLLDNWKQNTILWASKVPHGFLELLRFCRDCSLSDAAMLRLQVGKFNWDKAYTSCCPMTWPWTVSLVCCRSWMGWCGHALWINYHHICLSSSIGFEVAHLAS